MKDKVRKFIIILLSIVLLISLSFLVYKLIIAPMLNEKVNNELKNIYYNETNVETADDNGFFKLREINPDIQGWINIPNTVIDYAVLVPPKDDPQYYLKRDYKKDYTDYGSIFADSLCELNPNYKNVVIYGHNMNDGSMFADLLKYSDLEFYKSSPIITLDTVYEKGKWKIISVFKTNTEDSQGEIFNYLNISFRNSDDFLEFVYQVKARSFIQTPVDINEYDSLITLSTCSYEFKGFRTVVVARKVRAGELETVDVDKAKLSSNPLMPFCWYEKYGGAAPRVTSFKEAFRNGEINWYNPIIFK